jgi:endo-1,4-beta-xylanase
VHGTRVTCGTILVKFVRKLPAPSHEVRQVILRFLPSLVLAALLAGQATAAAQATASQTGGTSLRAAGPERNIIVGAAAAPSHLSEQLYADTLASQFRQLEPENQMKFGVIHPRSGSAASAYDFGPADKLVTFAESHNMLVRGHCFVWHQQVPEWLTSGIASKVYGTEALRNILQNHIATVAGHYAAKVWAWDVVNEAFLDNGSLRSTVWYNSPGIGLSGKGTAYIEQALHWAHAADPKAKLFYNDYDAESLNPKSDAIYAMAQDFRSRGVPLDGVGFQAHLKLSFNNPKTLESFAANLKRFNDLGLEIHITELDVALDSPDPTRLAAQGALYRSVAEICLHTPRCRVLQAWGFTDKYSWIPSYSKGKQGWALPFDADYRKKPAYYGLQKALQSK